MRHMAVPKVLSASALLLALAAPALGSSDDAWAEFRAQVEEACRAQLAEVSGEASIVVNPFGSESYGAAVVSVASGSGSDRMICIYSKATGTAELTAPFETGAGG